jgi:hypothetical protein
VFNKNAMLHKMRYVSLVGAVLNKHETELRKRHLAQMKSNVLRSSEGMSHIAKTQCLLSHATESTNRPIVKPAGQGVDQRTHTK